MAVEKKKAPRDRAERVEAVDDHLGHRVRRAREMRRLSREGLAEALGDITAQQLTKIEGGKNRLFANRLWAIARVLNMPVSWFFDGFMASQSAAAVAAGAAGAAADELTSLLTPENILLLEGYDRLPTTQRRLIRQMIAELIEPTQNEDMQESVTEVGGEAHFGQA